MTEIETQMIQAALQGQAQGYRFLMNRYGRQVQLLVAQWVTDMRDVEELTQDVFVRAFEHLSDYNPERASFGTWLSCIAHNIALMCRFGRRMMRLPMRLNNSHSLTRP